MRTVIAGGFALQALIFGVTAVALVVDGRGLPGWFIATFVAGTGALVAVLAMYAHACVKGQLRTPAVLGSAPAAMLVLIVASIVCTSSLHHFYPFRPSVAARLEGVPLNRLPPGAMLRFNYAMTGAAMLAATGLAIAYAAGLRRAAVVGVVTLAVLLLIPNDNCANAFNRHWVGLIGASPLMFAPASGGLLVAVCGLCGLWPRTSLMIVLMVCFGTLLVGIGHMSRVIW